jgi:hypothetical protein
MFVTATQNEDLGLVPVRYAKRRATEYAVGSDETVYVRDEFTDQVK